MCITTNTAFHTRSTKHRAPSRHARTQPFAHSHSHTADLQFNFSGENGNTMCYTHLINTISIFFILKTKFFWRKLPLGFFRGRGVVARAASHRGSTKKKCQPARLAGRGKTRGRAGHVKSRGETISLRKLPLTLVLKFKEKQFIIKPCVIGTAYTRYAACSVLNRVRCCDLCIF